VINADVTTLADLAFQAAARYPNLTVLRRSLGSAFVDVSGRQLFEQVRDLSIGLIDVGLSEGDRIALVAENRPEWCATDLAVQAAAAITVPIYPTLEIGPAGRDTRSTRRLR
jgi:long-chain acyl-CoA synthetase